jgi:hypothetical protein
MPIDKTHVVQPTTMLAAKRIFWRAANPRRAIQHRALGESASTAFCERSATGKK